MHPYRFLFKRMFEVADEMGFKVTSPEVSDYLFAAYFSASSIRDKVNAVAFTNRINAIRPASTANVYIVAANSDKPMAVMLFTHPEIAVEQIQDLLTEIDRDGHLDPDAYWRKMEPIIQEKWERAETAERLEYVTAGDDPLEAILETEVPEGAAGEIWRQIDD